MDIQTDINNFSSKKFPVTSLSGKEYLAKVEKYIGMFDNKILCVRLFTQNGYTMFRKKPKFEEVFWNYFEEHEEEEYNDYILAVKRTVEIHERIVEKERLKKIEEEKSFKKAVEEFNSWDGKC